MWERFHLCPDVDAHIDRKNKVLISNPYDLWLWVHFGWVDLIFVVFMALELYRHHTPIPVGLNSAYILLLAYSY